MAILFVMCGLSFSGKTALARRISAATGSIVVSYDELYATAPRDESITGLDEWYLVMGLVHERARAELASGGSVIVDNLNEDLIDRDQLRAIGHEHGAETIVVYVDTPLEVISLRRRLNERDRERGFTSDEEFAFVLSRFEAPCPPERSIRFGPEDDIEVWLDELQRYASQAP